VVGKRGFIPSQVKEASPSPAIRTAHDLAGIAHQLTGRSQPAFESAQRNRLAGEAYGPPEPR